MTTFSNAEVAFLGQGFRARGRNWAALDYATTSNCPQRILQRILEFRAKALGPEFRAFQEEQRRLANPGAPFSAAEDLDQQIQANRIF